MADIDFTAPGSKIDLTNCDREPIHIPGSIQPHGAMLICAAPDFEVTHASANAADFLGLKGDITGRLLGDVVGRKAAHDIRNAAAKSMAPATPGYLFGLSLEGRDGTVDVAAHSFEGRTFIELEPHHDDDDAYGPLELTRALTRRLADEKTVESLAAAAARMVTVMLGYDRVMVYKLLHNGAGRVIAERKRADLGSFLGQHFPASDIPAQARELYKRNWIRMISDVRYTPIPILPAVPASQPQIDMSYAQLRSVSPVHCEYLQNMGVGASMSVSIIVDGELWGLIACHHYSPKAVALPQRVGAELFGQSFSLQVEALERRARFDVAQAARARLDRIVAGLAPEDELHESLQPHLDDLAMLLPCDGAGVWINGRWLSHGVQLQPKQVVDLMALLDVEAKGDLWRTSQIDQRLPEFAVTDVAGVLAVPLSRTPRDYLIFFRSEESRFVEWAGDPDKPVGPLGDRLTPRKSFELWRQEVRGQSTPWTDADLAIGEAVQNYLRDVVLRHTEATAEERKRAEARRRLVNEELNHRVKNILALTKAIVEQSRRRATSVEELAESIHGRLRALAVSHDQITHDGGGGDLRSLFESEFAAYGGDRAGTRASLDGLPVRLTGRAYSSLAMVAHEMTTNAAKYGGLSTDEGRVAVAWSLSPQGDCVLTWVESGGPPVKPPSRSGFGSTLIAQVIPFDLDGEAEIDYPPEGAKARFVIPSRHILHTRAMSRSEKAGGARGDVDLRAKRVLLVEDQALIALDVEHSLRKLGADQVVIAPNTEAAAKRLRDIPIDIAVLDVNLGDGTSIQLAEELMQRGVPFVFATGYGDTIMIPEPLKNVPIVRKPYGEEALAAAIALAVEQVQARAAGGGS